MGGGGGKATPYAHAHTRYPAVSQAAPGRLSPLATIVDRAQGLSGPTLSAAAGGSRSVPPAPRALFPRQLSAGVYLAAAHGRSTPRPLAATRVGRASPATCVPRRPLRPAVLLYDSDGRLQFAGGVTPSRGHTGTNPGRSAIISALVGDAQVDPLAASLSPVYGCGLHDADKQDRKLNATPVSGIAIPDSYSFSG